MTRDRLFLLRPGFEDPAYPGQRFYCSHCALIEGVLGGLGVEGVTAALEPQPETCCVALRAADGSTPSRAPAPGPEATGPAPRRRT